MSGDTGYIHMCCMSNHVKSPDPPFFHGYHTVSDNRTIDVLCQGLDRGPLPAFDS